MGTRPERVQEALRREVSVIIQKEIKDPRLGFVTVTRVKISKDLKNADIYYSVLGEEKDRAQTEYALKSAGGYVRKLIGDRIKMKFVPALRFFRDRSMDHTRRVYEILDDIKKGKKSDEPGKDY